MWIAWGESWLHSQCALRSHQVSGFHSWRCCNCKCHTAERKIVIQPINWRFMRSGTVIITDITEKKIRDFPFFCNEWKLWKQRRKDGAVWILQEVFSNAAIAPNLCVKLTTGATVMGHVSVHRMSWSMKLDTMDTGGMNMSIPLNREVKKKQNTGLNVLPTAM